MATTDDTVLDQLDAAVSTLRLTARITNARVAQVNAELAALLVQPVFLYQCCLFCAGDYGFSNGHTVRAYDTIRAACGCEGVGKKCAEGMLGNNMFRCYGCSAFNKHALPKCYTCNERQKRDLESVPPVNYTSGSPYLYRGGQTLRIVYTPSNCAPSGGANLSRVTQE